MKYYLSTLVFLFSLSAIQASNTPVNKIESYLITKIQNGDLLSTSNGYLMSSFERDRAILRDIEPVVKRKGDNFLSVKTEYYYIEYQLYSSINGDAIITMLENADGKKIYRFVRYKKNINGFQPLAFQDICPQWRDLVGEDPERTTDKLNQYRFYFHKDGFSQTGRNYPTLEWDGKSFVPTKELLEQASKSVNRTLDLTKKR